MRWRFPALAGVLVVAALILRLYRIGDPELWTDEAFSFYAATVETDLSRHLLTENSPPLYYLLLRLWVGIAGTSEVALRLPSAIFGTLFVATVIWAGTTLFNRKVGLWAGMFAAVAPIHIHYSQEARAYSLLMLLLLLVQILVWRALERGTWQSWSLVSLGVAGALYSHYFAALALIPTAFLVWAWRGHGKARMWPAYGAAMLGGVLLLVPWFAWSLVMRGDPVQGTDFLKALWERTPPALAIPKSLELFGLGSQAGFFPPVPKVFPSVVFPAWLRLTGLGALVMLGLWVALPWRDQHLRIPDLARRKAWLWALLLIPLSTLWLLSLYRPIYLVGRYDMIAFPAYALLIGLALGKAQAGKNGLILTVMLAASLFVPIGTKLFLYYDEAVKSYDAAHLHPAASSRFTAALLNRVVHDGDVVVFTGLRGIRTQYSLGRLGVQWTGHMCEQRQTGRRFACRMYPRETEGHPAVYDSHRVMASDSAVLDDLNDFLAGLAKPAGVLWLVFEPRGNNDADPKLAEMLDRKGYRLVTTDAGAAPGVVQAIP